VSNDLEMKQVIINGRFLTQHISGVQRYAREIVRAFDDMLESGDPLISRFRFELLAPDRELIDPPELKHIPIRRVGKNSGHRWEQNTLPGYVGNKILFCPGNTAPLRSLLGKSQVVVTVHDLSYLYFPQSYSLGFRAFYRLLIPIILRKADRVITVSKSEESSILNHYPFAAKRLSAIQNGGFGTRYKQMLNSNSVEREADMLLYVGAMNSRKNPQGVIGAFAQLKDEKPRLKIAGAGGKSFHDGGITLPDEALQRTEFLGQVNETERLINLYQQATAFVFPSFYEASPLPPIEAMACGCPVVAADIPSLKERCGDAAIFCKPHSKKSIAEAITRLLNDEKLQQTMRERGFERAKKFTWEECARNTAKELLQAAGEETV